MKRYITSSLITFMLIGISALLYQRVGHAGDRKIETEAVNYVPAAADVFTVGRNYTLAMSDAGNRMLYSCTVISRGGDWVQCNASWQTANGRENAVLWLNTNSMSVVRPN